MDLPEEMVNKIDVTKQDLPKVMKEYNKRNDEDNNVSDSDYSAPFADCYMRNIYIPDKYIYMLALPNNRVLSLGFNFKGQED